MLKQQAAILTRIAVTLDNLVLVSAFLIAYYLRWSAGAVGELNNYIWLLLFATPCWYALLNHHKLYESLRLRPHLSIIWDLFKVHAYGGMVLASIIYVMAPHDYSRLLFAHFLVISFFLMSACKLLVKLILSSLRRKGFNTRNILIVGTGPNALKMCELVCAHQEWGLSLVGLISVPGNALAPLPEDCPVRGTIDHLINTCKEQMVDEVVFALEKNDTHDLTGLFQDLEELGLTVRIMLDYLAPRSSKTEVSLLDNKVPILTYNSVSFNSDQLLAKRCLDFAGSLLGLAITALLLPFIALAIKLDSPGPVFFGQPRVRENGRHFVCWKFRTMYADADARKQELMALNEMNGAMFKLKNDPRVTRVGRILRKLSLDEFPQFWNVLHGEMSLVGTRPPTPDEVATYQNWHRKRISIKPGITGLWQISGRNQIRDFDDVVRLDLLYIETWTIWLDIKILLKTPLVMLSRQGAS